MDWIHCTKEEEEEKDVTKATADLIKVPEALQKDTKWHTWKESLQTYLKAHQKPSTHNIGFIFCESDKAALDMEFTTVHKELLQRVVLFGTELNANNGKIHIIIIYYDS
jgi:hypothetical protein